MVAACGGEGGAQATGVASLEDTARADDSATDAETEDNELEADEAALAFSQCMREEGIEFPDIGVDANGNPDLRGAFQDGEVDPRSPEFQAAMEPCRELLEGVGFGGGRANIADNPEIQDALVEFSECLRDEGLDVGDAQLGGGPAPGAGPGPGAGQGRGQDGFGDRSDRIASALDLDPEDPTVAAALELCNPVLDAALGQFGPGAAGS